MQIQHKKNPLQPLKDLIRPYTPKFIFKLISKYQDDTCMEEMVAPLFADLKKKKIKLNTIQMNEVFSNWYLMKIREDLEN